MKNTLFLLGVLAWILILFSLRYVGKNINDTQLTMLFVTSLIVILILRKALSISFK
jgi:hypothetical protein